MSKPLQVAAFYIWLYGLLLIGLGLLVFAVAGGTGWLATVGGWAMVVGAVVLVVGIAYRVARRSYLRADATR